MAEGFSTAAANSALDTLVATYRWVKLHVGAPGAAGTANPATETTRKQATYGTPAAGGAVANTVALTWPTVPAAEDYTHFTAWTLVTGGAFGFSGTIVANPVGVGDDFTVAIGGLTATLPLAS